MNNLSSSRLASLDLIRGIGVLLLNFVCLLWLAPGIPAWIFHAPSLSNALYLSDYIYLVFPFCLGLSLPYSWPQVPNARDWFKFFIRVVSLILLGKCMTSYQVTGQALPLLALLLLFIVCHLRFLSPPLLLWTKFFFLAVATILLFLIPATNDWGVLGILGANLFTVGTLYGLHLWVCQKLNAKERTQWSLLLILALILFATSYTLSTNRSPPLLQLFFGAQTFLTFLGLLAANVLRRTPISLIGLSLLLLVMGILFRPLMPTTKVPMTLAFIFLGASPLFLILLGCHYSSKRFQSSSIHQYFSIQGQNPLLYYLYGFIFALTSKLLGIAPYLWFTHSIGGIALLLNHTLLIILTHFALNKMITQTRSPLLSL